MQENASMIFSQASMTMPSHRDLLEYHEHAVISVSDGVVVASKSENGRYLTTNIPAMNIAFLLLGPGCSISTAAAELLAAANVVVGFCGGDASPLSSTTDVSFLVGRSEYGPTEYQQAWGQMWYDSERRNLAAKLLLKHRFAMMEELWPNLGFDNNVYADDFFKFAMGKLTNHEGYFKAVATRAITCPELLGVEGAHVAKLYGFFCHRHEVEHKRDDKGPIDALLKQGNYIAYGLAATALRALNIEFSYPLLHGKTRRGALVFDIADIIKDALIVPTAFEWRNCGHDEYRRRLKEAMTKHHCLSKLIDVTKELARTA